MSYNDNIRCNVVINMKSYNKDALRGKDIDDKEWQLRMAESGISIPDELLYTKEGPRYVIKEIRKMNEVELTKQLVGNVSLAKSRAKEMHDAALSHYEELLKK
jgi:rhamnose utilization protein RhaD (predicted bifunctional aldolase and dehydrogenase)